MSVEHLSADQLARLKKRSLAGAELLAADDHLAACEACRDKLGARSMAAPGWAELADGMRAAAAAAAEHIPYELLQGYADGECPEAERTRMEAHLAECASCRNEAADLMAFGAALRARRAGPVRYARYLILGPIAAVLAIGVVLMQPREQGPQLAAWLRDGGKTIGLDRGGRLAGAGAAAGAERDMLVAALRDGRIAVAIPEGLRGKQSVLLGADSGEKRFRVLSPVGEPVLRDEPEFRWEALGQARAYKVEVFDADYQPVASSPEVSGTAWTADRPLERGKAYAWQVTAMRNGSPVKAPEPADAEARFQIVSGADANAIEQARGEPAGHLLMATLYAHAGLCREALAEMDALVRENGGSALVRQIRAGMAGQCDGGAQR